ncbi:DUF4404 family protein [Planctomicrobium sp. SH527]|uniref:DUF4404 family protein n=1 Tax=Planctomicrobium sp. SH527 TaxID=3448123 RepID=UPI003F5ADE18
MEDVHLKETLAQLKSHLQKEESVDPESQILLEQISTDLNSFLNSQSDAKLLSNIADERDTFLDDLLDLTSRFEETHPKLAAAIGQVASALSRIGI